jgi:poly-gamma-glutamate capsule biosynthesis protein CapA/YwtB (metallophosphatase superfamily)
MAGDARTLFLAGDVMIGRGVDQILPHPVDPTLRERYVVDARTYVELAEEVSGPIERPVPFAHVWGDALGEFARARPDARVVNLETSVTRSDTFWPDKPVCYRASPENAACLTSAGLDVCTLANNHVLDFGWRGLTDTLDTVRGLGIACPGAGRTLEQAMQPAIVDLGLRGRVLVLAVGSPSSGIPRRWAASAAEPGVWLVPDLSTRSVHAIRRALEPHLRPHDLIVLSIHWGPNWGYPVTTEEQRFARALVDEAGVHVVHGHSSHHVRGLEVYRGALLLYGCGDLLTDYEGIGGDRAFRGELGALYFPTFEGGRLAALELSPTRVRGLRITRAETEDARWLFDVLVRESAPLGTRLRRRSDDAVELCG